MLSKRQTDRVEAIASELELFRIESPSAITALLPDIRELIGLESIACICPVERASGWGVERFDIDNFVNGTRFRQLTLAFLSAAPHRYGFFDPDAPEVEQQNVPLELSDLIPDGERTKSRGFTEVLRPLHLDQHHVVRALVCDETSLLAWFGGFQPLSSTEEQRALMRLLVPALRRRLLIERRMSAAPLMAAALAATLEQISCPAFVVNAAGRIFEANTAGQALLATNRNDVSSSLHAALSNQPGAIAMELTPLKERGVVDHWLAVVSVGTSDVTLTRAVARAVVRFKLTPRQREVLVLVLQGRSNTSIASTLGISERAVEQHVSTMFDRAAVDNRAALVARVLLER